MISRYLEYKNPEIKKEILNAEDKTIMVFSRLNEVITFNATEVNKLDRIFDLIREERDDDELDEGRETLYGMLVDAFSEEDYFANSNQTDVEGRELKIVELANMPDKNEDAFGPMYSDETLLAFGYLNSKDIYLEPSDLEILISDLKWFVFESGCCKEETSVFVEGLINKMETELQLLNDQKYHVNLFVLGL